MSAGLTFYDAADPPSSPPAADGCAFYIGGDTPHVWTPAEIAAIRTRYLLPVFVRSYPRGNLNGLYDARSMLHALEVIGAPRGSLVAVDTETAADPAYMRRVYQVVTAGGYHLMDYGSQSALLGNELPAGGYYWGADWTSKPHIHAPDAGTQYASGATYDLSVFKPGLPFWERVSRETPGAARPGSEQWLPDLELGANGGPVAAAQALMSIRLGMRIDPDGAFGPHTLEGARLVQAHAGLTVDGVVGTKTWRVLLGLA